MSPLHIKQTKIFAYPVRPGAITDPNTVVVNFVDTPTAEFELQCYFDRNSDDGRIIARMEWQMVPEDPLSLEAYAGFVIFANFVAGPSSSTSGVFTGFDFPPKQVSD